MMTLRLVLIVAVVAVAGLHPGVEGVIGGNIRAPSEEVEAREVVARFFSSLNARRYEQVCGLLADGYYIRHPGSSRRLCTIGLRVGFQWSHEIRWRIRGVRWRGNTIVVGAVADGAPGRILLVAVKGRLRVLDLVDDASKPGTGGDRTRSPVRTPASM
jgi:hypothetical protein